MASSFVALTDREAARFWSMVDRSAGADGCWKWTGSRLQSGYGSIRIGGRAGETIYSHRLCWMITNGSIPPRMFVCHRCDNPACVNPDHLFLGTNTDNVRDMWAKGRQSPPPIRSRITAPQVAMMRLAHHDGVSMAELAMTYGVSRNAVQNAVTGISWPDAGGPIRRPRTYVRQATRPTEEEDTRP